MGIKGFQVEAIVTKHTHMKWCIEKYPKPPGTRGLQIEAEYGTMGFLMPCHGA